MQPIGSRGYMHPSIDDIFYCRRNESMNIELLNHQYVELMRQADRATSRQEAIDLINRASVLAQKISAMEQGIGHSQAA